MFFIRGTEDPFSYEGLQTFSAYQTSSSNDHFIEPVKISDKELSRVDHLFRGIMLCHLFHGRGVAGCNVMASIPMAVELQDVINVKAVELQGVMLWYLFPWPCSCRM